MRPLSATKTALLLAFITLMSACTSIETMKTQPKQAVTRIFELQIAPDKLDEFNRFGKHNIQNSVNHEQGVLAMYVLADKQDPYKLYVVEAYADETAYQAHRSSAHFQAWLNSTKEMIVGRKVIETTPIIFGSKAVKPQE